MSKKKATMTLKDFHGGSIPSDLPLPLAPGVTVKANERTSFDRPAAWGNPVGRSDHRLRPGSAGTARNFDDRAPFLNQNSHIGRNFDEDERKPLDGPPGPRRAASDENLRPLPTYHHVEPKIDVSAYARVPNRPSSTPGSQYSSSTGAGSYTGRSADVNRASSQINLSYGASSRVGNVGPHQQPNAWGIRKEAAGIREAAPPAWSAPEAAMKLAHASALEKVSSGRWQSKQHTISQMDVETVSRRPDTETDFHYRDKDILYNKSDYAARNLGGGVDYHHSAALSRQVGMSLTLDDDVHLRSKESRTPVSMEAYERNNVQNIGKLGGAELQSTAQSDLAERPKLKLLPRSRPLENPEAQMEYKPVYQQQPTPVAAPAPAPVHAINPSQSRGLPNLSKVGSHGSDSGGPIVERPRLNLKPRSESIEVDSSEIKRQTVFGGARPRELVLKDRGIDNISVNSDELVQSPHRVKQDVVKSDRVPLNTHSPRYTEKSETAPVEHRTGKHGERREPRLEGEKNWRVENWRNNREFDKQPRQPQQQVQERPPSPETWRKPIEQAKPAQQNPDGQGMRFGKAASAVELAQAFSKSISDTDRGLSGQRGGPPGRGQVPFSRLTGPSPRPQINGY